MVYAIGLERILANMHALHTGMPEKRGIKFLAHMDVNVTTDL